ncbi:MAG: LLM class flavin-dependent oxidoreductase [Actinomycetota bacterium]|nr:LLM class flavin-dependent oxidoreductase [Actinomycetota bacterium]
MTRIGILFNTDRMIGSDFLDYARRVEAAGIESVWLAELFGREPFAASGALLGVTTTLKVGTAIANTYVRDATAAAAASATLAEISGNRFELGLGVSNRGLNQLRGHTWTPPAPRLEAYVQAVRAARLTLPKEATITYPIQVAAHGPKMLEVAAANADGVFTYVMNVDHTTRTRATLPDSVGLTPMTMCLLCPEPDRARELCRKALGMYMGLDYYHRAWRKLGFTDDDFTDGGSDRLVDAIVAWGSIDDIKSRLADQTTAGAERVVVVPLNPVSGLQPDWTVVEQLVD